MTDILVACQRYLASKANLTALLVSDAVFDTWIFRETPQVQVEGSGQCALVLSIGQGWANPSRFHTTRVPFLEIEIHADPDRDVALNVAIRNAEEKGLAIDRVLDSYLHVPQGGEIMWDDLRVISSLRKFEPFTRRVERGDKGSISTIRYGLETL